MENKYEFRDLGGDKLAVDIVKDDRKTEVARITDAGTRWPAIEFASPLRIATVGEITTAYWVRAWEKRKAQGVHDVDGANN